ncbi:hypothetical protein [Pseudoxanthomonas sp. UTMC 1351]|uniref:hypothetical protein n=1 Tax=Pseudoxanthomonas sp. UTMC 1351 TaxID=2695853 RepID=UPI0034CDCD24
MPIRSVSTSIATTTIPAHAVVQDATETTAKLSLHDQQEIRLLGDAERQLASGTIVVGEHHDQAAAREFAMMLIDHGCVSDLYLEFPDLSSDTFGGDPNQRFSEYLNGLDASQVRSDAIFQDFSDACAAITGALANSMPLPQFIAYAKEHGVRVHLIDNAIPTARSSADKLIERNLGMGACFHEVGSATKPKGLILVGANHCDLGRSDSIPSICGIAEQAVYDLSQPDHSNASEGWLRPAPT